MQFCFHIYTGSTQNRTLQGGQQTRKDFCITLWVSLVNTCSEKHISKWRGWSIEAGEVASPLPLRGKRDQLEIDRNKTLPNLSIIYKIFFPTSIK